MDQGESSDELRRHMRQLRRRLRRQAGMASEDLGNLLSLRQTIKRHPISAAGLLVGVTAAVAYFAIRRRSPPTGLLNHLARFAPVLVEIQKPRWARTFVRQLIKTFVLRKLISFGSAAIVKSMASRLGNEIHDRTSVAHHRNGAHKRSAAKN